MLLLLLLLPPATTFLQGHRPRSPTQLAVCPCHQAPIIGAGAMAAMAASTGTNAVLIIVRERMLDIVAVIIVVLPRLSLWRALWCALLRVLRLGWQQAG